MNRLLTHSLGPISFGLPLNKISFKWFCGIPTILNTHEEKWTWVWNLKLQKNIKHFLWFTYRDNIFYSYFLLEKSFKIKMWIHTLRMTRELNPFVIISIFFPFLITSVKMMLYDCTIMPWGVILNSLVLHARLFWKSVTTDVSRARDEHRFILWTRSQANINSFKLTS